MAKAGKTVMVTGASGGIGSALTKRLANEGWRVFATARDPSTVPTVKGAAGEVIALALELRDEQSVAGAGAEVRERVGERGLDALVNNAGVIVQGPTEMVPAGELRRQFEINVFGQVAVTQVVLPLLRAAHGRVVNVGAPTGDISLPLLGPLAASKAALHSLNDTLRMELGPQGISVSLIVPGALETEIFAKAAAAAEAAGPASAEAARVYGPVIESSARKMAEMKAAPVDRAADAIRAALTDRRPKVRYTAGSDARQFAVLGKLPTRLRDRVVTGAVGYSRDAFAEGEGNAVPAV